MEEILNKILDTQNIIIKDIKDIKLEQKNMQKRFDKIDEKLKEHDEHFAKIDKKLEEHDQQFIKIDEHFAKIDKKLEEHDQQFIKIDEHFAKIDKKQEEYDKHVIKTDKQFIDVYEKLDDINKQIILIDYNQEQNTAKLLEGFNMLTEKVERYMEDTRKDIRVLQNSLYRVEMQNIKEHKLFKDKIRNLEKKII